MDVIAVEKAKEMFLKYFRVCLDREESLKYSLIAVNDLIATGYDLEYWQEVKTEIEQI